MNIIEKKPWGFYEVLFESEFVKVKRIVVSPGSKLSYQSHQKRSETWKITRGSGIFVKDDTTFDVEAGAICVIPKKSKHRIINNSDTDLEFIEIQSGEYFGEDDIKRFEDDYGREDK